jgi:hypothetical protein
MRLLIKLGMSACLLYAMGDDVLLRAERPLADNHSPQLLSQEQGRALVDLAISHRSEFRPKPDCSHLVHKIYSLGGLNYDYAGSRDIYRGTEGFERVSTPQPGDLIVWLGHVGIVVAPREKTFFSSVRSGVITESWAADYWHRRGHPRFYRYRISEATDPILLAALTEQAPESMETEDVSMPRTAPGYSATRPVQRPGSTTIARNAAVNGANATKPLSNATTSTGAVADRQPPQPAARPPLVTGAAITPSEPPAVVALMRQRGKPSKEDVFVALTQSGTVRAQKLIAGQPLDMTRPVSVIAQIDVQKIKLKNDVGTIQLKLTEGVSVEGGKITVDKTVTRELCLYRRGDAWVICDSQERVYIPQEQALHAFERQAEIFLQQSPGTSSTRAVVKVLDILFDRDEATRQRAALK